MGRLEIAIAGMNTGTLEALLRKVFQDECVIRRAGEKGVFLTSAFAGHFFTDRQFVRVLFTADTPDALRDIEYLLRNAIAQESGAKISASVLTQI